MTEKTIQLRRYDVKPEEWDAFLAWWSEEIPPLRAGFGFTIEFAYADVEHHQFVWAVSLPGDADAFREIEQGYIHSDERARVFEGVPQRVERQTVSLIEPFVG